MLLKDREPLGRHALSKELRLGEASVRTLVKRLKELGVVNVDPVGGCILTGLGRDLVKELTEVVPRIEEVSSILKQLALDKYSYAARVRKGDLDVMRVRDETIRVGASAALILKCVESKLIIPPGSVGEDVYPELRELKKLLGVEEGEWVVIAYSQSKEGAEEAILDWIATFLDP